MYVHVGGPGCSMVLEEDTCPGGGVDGGVEDIEVWMASSMG